MLSYQLACCAILMQKQTHFNRMRAFTVKSIKERYLKIVSLEYINCFVQLIKWIRTPNECNVMSLQMNELPGGKDKFAFVCQRGIHHPLSPHPHLVIIENGHWSPHLVLFIHESHLNSYYPNQSHSVCTCLHQYPSSS